MVSALLIFALCPASAAGSSFDPASISSDSLWAASQGTSVTSPLYPIDRWWTSFTISRQAEPRQRGLLELQQANTDLLNAYTLLAEASSDQEAKPVPVVDPLISGLYGLITGVRPNAPFGSLFKWAGDQALNLEGRGTTAAIMQGLLADFSQHQAAADHDLNASGLWQAAVVAQNRDRQIALLIKIQASDPQDDAVAALLLRLDPAGNTGQGSPNNMGNHGPNSHAGGNNKARGKGKKP